MIALIVKRSDGSIQKEIKDVFSVENSLRCDVDGNMFMEITIKKTDGTIQMFDTDKENDLIVSEESISQ